MTEQDPGQPLSILDSKLERYKTAAIMGSAMVSLVAAGCAGAFALRELVSQTPIEQIPQALLSLISDMDKPVIELLGTTFRKGRVLALSTGGAMGFDLLFPGMVYQRLNSGS